MRWRRWFPAPLLSLFLLIVWLLLSQSAAPGHWMLGGIMAWLAPWITRRLRPYGVAVRRPWAAVRLIWRVAVDIVKSNWDVSRSEEHTSELQSRGHLVCRLLLEIKKTKNVKV